jgi:hypothetical protein
MLKMWLPEQKRSLVANGLMLPFGNTRPLGDKNFGEVNFFFFSQSQIFRSFLAPYIHTKPQFVCLSIL